MHLALLALLALLAQTLPANDAATDWLLDQAKPPAATSPAATAPAVPATGPGSPFDKAAVADAPVGTIVLSDGTTLHGTLSTTPGKPLRFWVEEDKRYVDVPLGQIESMQAEVAWERDEPEWRFAAGGQDQKVYTGKTYPARELAYRTRLKNGDSFLGSIAGPIAVTTADPAGEKTQSFVLHKRDKGDVGVQASKLIYVKSVVVK